MVRRVARGQTGPLVPPSSEPKEIRNAEPPSPDEIRRGSALAVIQGPSTRADRVRGPSYRGIVGLLSKRAPDSGGAYRASIAAVRNAIAANTDPKEIQPLLQAACDHADWSQGRIANEILRTFAQVAWPAGTPLAARVPLPYLDHLLEVDEDAFIEHARETKDPELAAHLVGRLADAPPAVALSRARKIAQRLPSADTPPSLDGPFAPLFTRALEALDLGTEAMSAVGLAKAMNQAFLPHQLAAIATVDSRYFAACVRVLEGREHADDLDAPIAAFLATSPERVRDLADDGRVSARVERALVARIRDVDTSDVAAVTAFVDGVGRLAPIDALAGPVRAAFAQVLAATPQDTPAFARLVELHRRYGTEWRLPDPRIPDPIPLEVARGLLAHHPTREAGQSALQRAMERAPTAEALTALVERIAKELPKEFVLRSDGIDLLASRTDWSRPDDVAKLLETRKRIDTGLVHEWYEAAAVTVPQAIALMLATETHPALAEISYRVEQTLEGATPADAEALAAGVERVPAKHRQRLFSALCRASTFDELESLFELARRHDLEFPAGAAQTLFAHAWDDPAALRECVDTIRLREAWFGSMLDDALVRLGAIADRGDRDLATYLFEERRDSPDGRRSTFPAALIPSAFDLTSDATAWEWVLDLAGQNPFRHGAISAMQAALPNIDDAALLGEVAQRIAADAGAYALRGPIFERYCAIVDFTAADAADRITALSTLLTRPLGDDLIDRLLEGPPDVVIDRGLRLHPTATARPRVEHAITGALTTGTVEARLGRIERVLDGARAPLGFLRPAFDALRAEISTDEAPNHPVFQRLAWEVASAVPSLDLAFDEMIPFFGEARVFSGLKGDRDADFKSAIERVPTSNRRASLVAQLTLRHLLLDANVDEHRLERDLQKVARAMVTSWRSTGRRGSGQQRLSPAHEKAFVEKVYQPAFDRFCGMIDWSDDQRVKSVLGGIEGLAKYNVEVQLAPRHLDDLFGHGRTTDVVRAGLLRTHKDDAIRTRAERAWSELERTTTLSDALLMMSAPDANIRRMGDDVLARGFTADELRSALADPSLDFDGLAARVRAASDRILQRAPAPDTEAMVAEAIAPAYDRLCDLNDFTDRAKTQTLAQLPVAYAAAGYSLDFPARHAAQLHRNAANARELVLHPTPAVRQLEVEATRVRFTAATTLSARRQEYAAFTAMLARAPQSPAPQSKDRAAWQKALADAVGALDGDVHALKAEMLEALLADARALPDRAAALAEIQQILPPSVERDAELDALVADGWNDRAVLDAVHHYGAKTFTTDEAKLLVETIGSFPGDVAAFVAFLRGEAETSALIADAKLAATDAPHLERLRDLFSTFAPDTQGQIVTTAVDKMLTLVDQRDPNVERVARDRGFASARLLVDHVLDEKAFSAIAADPDGKDIIGDIRTVLDALPVAIRARIFTAVLLEPPTQDAPTLLKRIMVAAGAVAIKVGQQLSEDPAVPKRFRTAIEDVRDQNTRMTPLGVWSKIPPAQRPKIAALGPTLGTGSIKQVLLVRPDASLGIDPNDELVAAIVRDGVAEDIDGSVAALDVLPHMRHIGRRVKPMLERELDLPREALAFEELAHSAVGRLDIVVVPDVVASDHHFLMRRSTGGRTIAQITRARPLDPAERQRIERLHEQLVRAALDTRSDFMRDGKTFVLTDPHDANVSDDGAHLGLFDPGQFENLTPQEGDLFVRLLAAFSSDKWQRNRKEKLVAELMKHCELGDPNDGKNQSLEQRLVAAYDGLTTGSVSAKLEAFFLDASKNGVAIPNSYFGVAKMLNTLTAREEERGLAPVTERVIKDLYLDQQGPFGRLAKRFL